VFAASICKAAAVIGLTTVRQPLRESGRRGAELLLAAIERAAPRRATWNH
jgi:DNA-binding LacI/PurR family transcriptional regulator